MQIELETGCIAAPLVASAERRLLLSAASWPKWPAHRPRVSDKLPRQRWQQTDEQTTDGDRVGVIGELAGKE